VGGSGPSWGWILWCLYFNLSDQDALVVLVTLILSSDAMPTSGNLFAFF
jgi:hypothetical protein